MGHVTPGPAALTGRVRPRRNASIHFEPLDDGCALYDPVSGRVHILNLTAASIWTGCDGSRSLRDLAGEIRAGFGKPVSASRAVEDDVRTAVEELLRAGLLELERPPQRTRTG